MPDQVGNSTAAEDFAKALNIKFPVVYDWDQAFGVVEGVRFDKIVKLRAGRPVQIHAFVERVTGKLIKAAGWSAPAKRTTGEFVSYYNLYDPKSYRDAVRDADEHGSYLYSRS